MKVAVLKENIIQTEIDLDDKTIPLVIDLDGTLIKSDLLIESLFFKLANKPTDVIRSLAALAGGKAPFKSILADQYQPVCEAFPVNKELLAFAHKQKKRGRKIYLATASDFRLANLIAAHFGIFDGVFATNASNNLAGKNKADVLIEKFGAGGFDYAGNNRIDLSIWKYARHPILVNASKSLTATFRAQFPDMLILDER
jgi:phosphoserine phosphatase